MHANTSRKGSENGLRRRFSEALLEGVLQWVSEGKRVSEGLLEGGSEKGLSRRFSEGGNMCLCSVRPEPYQRLAEIVRAEERRDA